MKTTRCWTAVSVLGIVAILVLAATAAVAADEEGFVCLPTDKDLGGMVTTGNWSVDDEGVISLNPRPGEKGWQRYSAYLWTDKKYGDFILDLEYKYPKGGNSGVFVRAADRDNPVSQGIEVQILDSYGKKEPLGHHDHGGVIRTTGPKKNMSKPAGEWNRMIVTCRGYQMEVELNGEQIIDLDLSKSAVKDRPLEGYVGVQDHGGPIQFRNLRIKELE